MVNAKPGRTVVPPSNRDASPSKSRLPIGSTVPQRNTPTKVLQNIASQSIVRRSSARITRTASKSTSTITASSLQTSSGQAENHSSTRLGKAEAESSVALSKGFVKPTIPGKPATLVASKKPARLVEPIAYSRETLNGRLDLLHLSVIHSKAVQTQDQWKDDASGFYQGQIRSLQSRDQDIRRRESDHLVQRNASSFMSWSDPEGRLGQKIQDLSAVIHDMDQLTSVRGRYSLVIQSFEHWIALETASSDPATKKRGRSHLRKVEGLGDSWVRDVEALQMQLVSNAEKMLALGNVKPVGSELQRTIAIVEEMLRNMLEELETVVELEALARHEILNRKDHDPITAMTREFGQGLRLI